MNNEARVCRACQIDESGSGDNGLVEIFEKSSKIAYEIFLISQIKVNKHWKSIHFTHSYRFDFRLLIAMAKMSLP